MSIQSSVNSIINQAAAVSTISKVAKEGKEIKQALKEGSQDIKGSIEGLKVDREQLQAYNDYNQAMTNPNLRKIILSEQDRAVNNALMKERNTKFKERMAGQSLVERAQTLSKQKQDVPKIKEELIRLGKEKIDPTSPLYQKIMSQMEEKDGK